MRYAKHRHFIDAILVAVRANQSRMLFQVYDGLSCGEKEWNLTRNFRAIWSSWQRILRNKQANFYLLRNT